MKSVVLCVRAYRQTHIHHSMQKFNDRNLNHRHPPSYALTIFFLFYILLLKSISRYGHMQKIFFKKNLYNIT